MDNNSTAPPPKSTESSKSDDPGGPADVITGTLVVIDDDDFIREFLIHCLEGYFSVRGFDNATDALDHLYRFEVDLVISDIVMPDMSGIELRTKINEHERLAAMPFLFLTGQDNDEMEERAADLGIDDYITKPVDPDHLIQVVHRIITRSRQLRQNITRRLDRSINDALQPDLPKRIGGYQTALRFVSAGTGGGDIVLHRRLDQGDMIIIADILGHGVEAKFFAHAYAGYISGMLARFMDLSDPAKLLSDFNKAVCGDRLLGASSITSLALFIGDDGRVSMAGAGHPWPMIYRAGETGDHPVVEKIDCDGVLLGLGANGDYSSQIIDMNAHDKLVLFTDGLYECGDRRFDVDDCYRHLRSVISDHGKHGPHILADNMMADRMDQSTDNIVNDDITLVIIEFCG